MRCSIGSLALFAIALAAPRSSAQFVQTIPANFETTEANTQLAAPFNNLNLQVWHFVYDSTHFTQAFPIAIREIAFRPDGPQSPASWGPVTWPQIEVSVATSNFDWSNGAYDPIFANNIRSSTTFQNGMFTTPQATGTTFPKPFTLRFTHPTGHVYDPLVGDDLIIIVRILQPPTAPLFRLDAATGGIQATRYGNNNDPNATTRNVSSQEIAPIVEVTWVPASGVLVDFDAAPRSGQSPLTVQFTDQSYTNSAGITAWAWDFDNDGFIDSTQQNPSHTYTSPGSYDVRLVVTDPAAGMVTTTKPGFIVVDPPPSADFTADKCVGAVPLTVSFADLSTNVPTSWAWDFDNDGTIDSTQQNPIATYTTAGVYDVRLDATNVGGTGTFTKQQFIVATLSSGNDKSADILEYKFNEATGGVQISNTAHSTAAPEYGTVTQATWWTSPNPNRRQFDANEAGFGCMREDPNRSNGARVTTGYAPNVRGSFTMMWWLRRGAIAPTSRRAYALGGGGVTVYVGSVAGVSFRFASGFTGEYDTAADVTQNPGVWKHYAIVIDDVLGTAQWYIDGVPDANSDTFRPGNAVVSGTAFTVGSDGSSDAITNYYDMDDFRWYSGAFSAAQIQAAMGHENPTTSRFYAGCGPNGPLSISSPDAPQAGNPFFSIDVANAEPGSIAGVMIMGIAHNTLPLPYPPLRLPLALPTFGAGCALNVSLEQNIPYPISAGGSGSMNVPLPAAPAFRGSHAYVQVITLGPTGNFTFSPGYDIDMQ